MTKQMIRDNLYIDNVSMKTLDIINNLFKIQNKIRCHPFSNKQRFQNLVRLNIIWMQENGHLHELLMGKNL